jgi:biotin transport system substrate-specific component
MRPLKRMIVISLLAAILSISAYISIPLPISTVPFTLQSLFLMVIALSMPISISFPTVGLYLLLGAIGLPVFSNGTSGLTVLFGPTGGYLFGFLFATIVISFIKDKLEYFFGYLFAAFVGGVGVVYLFGVIGLMYILGASFDKAIAIGVIPFLPFDLLKAFIASAFVYKYKNIFNRLLK